MDRIKNSSEFGAAGLITECFWVPRRGRGYGFSATRIALNLRLLDGFLSGCEHGLTYRTLEEAGSKMHGGCNLLGAKSLEGDRPERAASASNEVRYRNDCETENTKTQRFQRSRRTLCPTPQLKTLRNLPLTTMPPLPP